MNGLSPLHWSDLIFTAMVGFHEPQQDLVAARDQARATVVGELMEVGKRQLEPS